MCQAIAGQGKKPDIEGSAALQSIGATLHLSPPLRMRLSSASLPPLRWLQRHTAGLLRLLYPPQCLGCGASVPEVHVPLCASCVRRLERPAPETVLDHIRRLPGGDRLASAQALWAFDTGGVVQRVQHSLKYGNRPAQGHTLGRWMHHLFPTAPADGGLVVPIPLHRTRQLERGYNQSALLAKGLADALGVPVQPALYRTRATASQTRLSRKQRWANVAGAFAVQAPAALSGGTVYLIDDVLTTGATLTAAAAALCEAGVAAVHVATLAFARS